MENRKLGELRERIEDAFSDYYEKAGGWEYRQHHLKRTKKYAEKLMDSDEIEQKNFDPEAVRIAALFHDIGRKEDIDDGELDPMAKHEEHAGKGAEIIEDEIGDMVKDERLELIRQIVENHHSEPELVETMIVQDADDLGKFSTIDIWRLVHYAAENQRTLKETFDYFFNELKPQNEQLIEQMNFEASKKAARKRLKRYTETMKTMRKEAEGEDIDG